MKRWSTQKEKLNLSNRRAKARANAPCAMDHYKELPVSAEAIARRADYRRDAGNGPALSQDVNKQLRIIVRALARSAAIAEHKSAENEREHQT
jgi:hypothetical protein